MKIGIISDTHDMLTGIDYAFDVFRAEEVELIVHCGDWTKLETVQYFAHKSAELGVTVRGVLGNNDREVDDYLAITSEKVAFTLTEGVQRFKMADKHLAVYHGHHAPTLKALLSDNFDVVCLGHSHKPRYDRIDDKVIINPGSTAFAIPRSREWRGSVAVYDSISHEVEFKYFSLK